MDNTSLCNATLKKFAINAICVSSNAINNYSYFDLQLINNGKVKDLEKFSNEIGLSMKQGGKPNFQVLHDKGVVRMEFVAPRTNALSLFESFTTPPEGEAVALLGKTFDGADVWMNLCNNPHLIVAGTTGSGKSTFMHTLIANMLKYNKVKLYLIDPKSIEFSEYEKLAGKLEVKYSYEEAVELLDHLVLVMNNRYECIRKGAKLTNIPPIVVIIDEFADLIMQDESHEFYDKLVILAQKSRAAKIHFVLGTQRPSADIIRGSIKANFPARIACRVPTHVDSKVILDCSGAEDLMGKGDAYLKDNDRSMIRFQIAYTNAAQVCNEFKV